MTTEDYEELMLAETKRKNRHPKDALYSDKFDCYYDPISDTWLEDPCGDSRCELCAERPKKPSECEEF